MQKLLLTAAGLCLFGALLKKEAHEDGAAVALSPFVAALAIEAVVLLLRRDRSRLMDA